MHVPRRDDLVVIGSDAYALVIAQALHSFGSSVTVLAESGPLAGEDPECVRILIDQLERQGMVLRSGVTIARVEAAEEGVGVVVQDAQGETTITGTHLFVASAWRPVTRNKPGKAISASRTDGAAQG